MTTRFDAGGAAPALLRHGHVHADGDDHHLLAQRSRFHIHAPVCVSQTLVSMLGTTLITRFCLWCCPQIHRVHKACAERHLGGGVARLQGRAFNRQLLIVEKRSPGRSCGSL